MHRLVVLEDLHELGLLGVLDLGLGLLDGAEVLLNKGLGVRVKSEHLLLVLERVHLSDVLLLDLLGGLQDRLDLLRLDDSRDISVGQNVGGQSVARLGGGNGLGAPDVVEQVEGTLGPDDESAKVRAGSELEQVEVSDVAGLNAGDVSESVNQTLVLGVDNEGTSSLGPSSVSELTLTGSDGLGLDDSGNVSVGTDGLEGGNGVLGLGDGLEVVGDNEGDLSDGLDSVTSGKDKGSNSGSSNGRGSGVSLLVEVHLDVPLSPGLGGSEHSSASAHVTESGLAGSVGSGSSNSGDSGNGSTSTPGLGGGLLTSVGGNGVGLSLVLGNTGPDGVDDIGSDGGLEDGGENDGDTGVGAGNTVDGNLRSSGHFCMCCWGGERAGRLE